MSQAQVNGNGSSTAQNGTVAATAGQGTPARGDHAISRWLRETGEAPWSSVVAIAGQGGASRSGGDDDDANDEAEKADSATDPSDRRSSWHVSFSLFSFAPAFAHHIPYPTLTMAAETV